VTHQYVNPLVAIVLGAVVLGETFDAATILGGLIVIGAVFATIRSESRKPAPVSAAVVEQARSAPPVRAK
jgi:drug/metabolite transporter (DMT)-like permease